MDFGCPVLRAQYFEFFMAAVDYFGHGALGSAVGLLLLAHGYTYDNQRTKRAGIAVLAALMISGVAVELMKHFIRLQIPPRSTEILRVGGRCSFRRGRVDIFLFYRNEHSYS